MDENKDIKKDFSKIFLVLIIILTIIGIFIYFAHNTTSDTEEIAENSDLDDNSNNINDEVTIKELGVDDLLVSSLYSYIEKTPTDIGQYYINETFYKDGKTSYNDLSNELKILTVFQNLTDDDCNQVDASTISNKLKYQIDEGTVKLYSKETFDSKLKEIFGVDANVNYESIDGSAMIIDYLKDDQEFACYSYPGGGFGSYVNGISSLYKAEKTGNYIYLYDKYMYKEYNSDGTVSYYTSSDKKDKIDTTTDDDSKTINDFVQIYGDKIKSYKHTFMKDQNGDYHWIETEQM